MNDPAYGNVKLTYFLAIVMVVFGAIGIDTMFRGYAGSFNENLKIFGKILFIIAGIAIIAYPKKSNMVAIGLYAIALGLNRVFSSVVDLFSPKDSLFYFGLVLMAIGLSLMYCGFSYLRGTSRNTTRAMLLTSATVIGCIVYVAFLIRGGIPWGAIIEHERDLIVMAAMYLVYIAVLNTREVHDNIPVEKVRANLEYIADTVYAGENVSISKKDLDLMMDGFADTSKWDHSESGTPVECQILISLNVSGGERNLIVQKWKEKEGIYLTLIGNVRGSFVRGYRSHVLSVIFVNDSDDGHAYADLFGENGKCARFIVTGGGEAI